MSPSHEPLVAELPEYLAEPRDPREDLFRVRDLLASAHSGVRRLTWVLTESPAPPVVRGALPRGVSPPRATARQLPELSAGFVRLVTLPASLLAAALDEWWTAANDRDVVVVERRFELGEPHAGWRAGWTMRGRVRRLPCLHWLPVVVEMSPFDDRRTMLTMTPQARVLCSPRYFRTGHSVLDRLTTALTATSAGRTVPG